MGKFLHAKAQGKKDDFSVQNLKMCRSALRFCGNNAMHSVKKSRLRRKMTEREQNEREAVDKICLAASETSKKRESYFREEERLCRIKKQDYKSWFKEKKKNFPKNRELWREIALLMT